MEDIIVFCAHPDDQIFGPGGTLAKYAKEGKNVHIVIFCYGESTPVLLKKDITKAIRVQETKKANKIIKAKSLAFYALNEGKFLEKEKLTKEKIKKLIKKTRPTKIFTHSDEDPHPDHRAVVKIVLGAVDEMSYKCDVLSFDVWGFFNPKKTGTTPKIYVDISDTFQTKIKALRCFPSQWMSLISLLWSVYASAIKHGIEAKVKYAERFFKVR